MEFKYNNKKIILSTFDSESENIKQNKIKFIKKMEKKQINANLVNKYSKIWVNIKYKKCVYNKDIFNFIKNIDNSI